MSCIDRSGMPSLCDALVMRMVLLSFCCVGDGGFVRSRCEYEWLCAVGCVRLW